MERALPLAAGHETIRRVPAAAAGRRAGQLRANYRRTVVQRRHLDAARRFGGAAFTDFQRGTATAGNAYPDLATFQRRLSAQTTATAGGSISYWIVNGWGLRASISFAPSAFAVWNDDAAQHVLDEHMGGERETYPSLSVWYADASILFRMPFTLGNVVPYGIVGGGVVDYRAGRHLELPPEARDRFSDGRWRTPAAVVGVGAVFPLQRYTTC
jgi:hypothetical protein